MARCPRCDAELVDGAGDGSECYCEGCHGVFVPEGFVELPALASFQGDGADVEPERLTCPRCMIAMRPVLGRDFVVDQCVDCGGVWLDAGDSLPGASESGPAAAAARYLAYSLSLPERIVRGTVGLGAGALKEAAAFVVPRSFQSSKSYEIVVRNSLTFLAEKVGGVPSRGADAEEAEDRVPEGFVARKAAGSFVELVGLATLHLSPIWALAIVSDVAHGTRVFVGELGDDLKKRGIIEQNSTLNHVEDVLVALGKGSGSAASMFDLPPFTVAALKETLAETRDSLAKPEYQNVLPLAEIERYWAEMKDAAKKEDVGILEVSGAITMRTLDRLGAVGDGALASVRVAGGLLDRHVVSHYRESLETVVERGLFTVVAETYGHYVRSVWESFSIQKGSVTEEMLSGRPIAKAFRKVRSWFSAG